ncbi:SEC5 [Candida pseudojiufengensis]|uniref:SEC5 n=1 Tax=Candida pseudojiufengensis TaxID=497109 RepID=UPI002224F797|nr:SEC5 [Candida pseudojiufengensis]KAI5965408.1 SEC5 [Candida pseudojiufengensis]
MIDFDPRPEQILSIYNLKTIKPTQRSDLLSIDKDYSTIDLKNSTVEEKFKTLNSIINSTSFNELYQSNNDLEDPLKGSESNVATNLKNLGVIKSSNDPALNNYLITSHTFNSYKYLTTIQKDTPLDVLEKSLKYLEKSIHSHARDLQHAIDINFEIFVTCKYQIDDKLIEFDKSKSKVQQDRESSKYFNPQRHTISSSKSSTIDELTSELESSLNNLRTTSTLMIKPIEENKLKEDKYSKISNFIKSNEFFFNLSSELIHSLSVNNNRKFIDDYNKYMKEKKTFLQRIQQNPEDSKIKLTIARTVFQEIEEIARRYRDKIYSELLSSDHEVNQKDDQKFMALVENLVQLNENDQQMNKYKPIADFLNKQIEKLENDFELQVNKFDSKFLLMQNKLVDYVTSLKPERRQGSHINYISEKYEIYKTEIQSSKTNDEKMLIIEEAFQSNENLDLSLINETWLVLFNFINYLQTLFVKLVDKFLNNYSYYFKMGVDPQGIIRDNFLKSINQIVLLLMTLFDDENKNRDNQLESQPSNYKQFVPCYSNSLSTINHLNRIQYKVNQLLTHLGNSIIRIGNMTNFKDTNKNIKTLKNASSQINQKILEAVCSTWINDCGQFYELEDWKIEEKYNIKDGSSTKLIDIIEYYQLYMLSIIGKLIKFKDDETESGIVAPYPSKRILMSIEIQFMRTLNIIIDSLMKKYNMDRQIIKQQLELEKDQTKIEIFKILTMNNFDKLSRVIYPRLIHKFDQVFNKDLSKQNLKLFADIDKASLTIIDDILEYEKRNINVLVEEGFEKYQSSSYFNQDIGVDQYIFEILMHFVKLVYKIKPLTSEEIFVTIINELQSNFLKHILDNLRVLQLGNLSDFNELVLFNLKLNCNFVLQIFENSNKLKFNDSTFKLLQLILKEVEIKKQEFEIKGEPEKLEDVLNDFLSTSSIQFNCF